MKATGWVPFLMLVLGDHFLEAQPRASEPRFHFGVARFWEIGQEPHFRFSLYVGHGRRR